MSTQMLTGTTIEQLNAQCDSVLAMSQRYRSVEILRNARIHLTDLRDSKSFPASSKYPEMDDGDMFAADLLAEIQYCLETPGQTAICALCNQMRGLHSRYGEYCRNQGGLNALQKVLSNTFIAKR